MTLEVLQTAMLDAMKNHEKTRKDTLSALVSAVKKAAIDNQCKENITEDLVNNVILKEKKTVKEMIDTCPSSRTDLIEEYTYRLCVIDEFAPKMMSKNEIRVAVNEMLAAAGIQPNNKGAVMKVVAPNLKGKADMKLVNEVISELL